MKTLILIWFISLSYLSYSQTLLFKDAIPETIAEAIILSEVKINSSKSSIINNSYLEESITYLSSVYGKNIPENILDVQRLIARYNIETLVNDCPNCDEYKITIQGLKNSKAIVKFDKNGKILETYETYKNVCPPLDIKKELNTDYANWAFTKSSFLYIYDKTEKDPRSIYNIDVLKENNTRKLRFNLSK